MSTPGDWLETLEESEAGDAVELARTVVNGFQQKRDTWEAEGISPLEADLLYQRAESLIAAESFLPSSLIKSALDAAVSGDGPAMTEQRPSDRPGEPMPLYSSGCASIDKLTGGCCGYTCIVGPPKLGKSLLVRSATVEAARNGWRVLSLDAENNPTSIANSLLRYCGRISDTVDDRLTIRNVLSEVTPRQVADIACDVLERDDERLLIALDSISRLVDLGTRGNYFDRLKGWVEFARLAVLHSNGKIAVLGSSEQNQRGGDRGERSTYSADLVIRGAKVDSDNVSLRVSECRYAKEGDLGEHYRNWSKGVFEQARPDGVAE